MFREIKSGKENIRANNIIPAKYIPRIKYLQKNEQCSWGSSKGNLI
jgi:hypothetical protein